MYARLFGLGNSPKSTVVSIQWAVEKEHIDRLVETLRKKTAVDIVITELKNFKLQFEAFLRVFPNYSNANLFMENDFAASSIHTLVAAIDSPVTIQALNDSTKIAATKAELIRKLFTIKHGFELYVSEMQSKCDIDFERNRANNV